LASGRFEDLTFCKPDILDVMKPDVLKPDILSVYQIQEQDPNPHLNEVLDPDQH
jgi:hypothetical protein